MQQTRKCAILFYMNLQGCTEMKKFEGKRVCVACSGGADSLCLLHYLYKRAPSDGFFLSAVHVEHGLRGESSKEDAAFVAKFCDTLHIPLYTFTFDCRALAKKNGTGIEEAARNARYGAFKMLLSENKADVIATAHHAQDEAETVLFHLLRGASLTGAGGIREERNGFIRPFLHVTKAEILAYAEENKLEYRVDETNFIADTTRNKLRLEILPRLEEIVPGAAKNLTNFSFAARRDDEFLYELSAKYVTAKKSDGGEKVCVRAFDENGGLVAEPLFARACVTAMKLLGIGKDYTRAHIDALSALRMKQTGSAADLPCGVKARRVYGDVVFSAEVNGAAGNAEIPFGYGVFRLGGAKILITESEAEAAAAAAQSGTKLLRADGAALCGSVFRRKKAGDTFRKFGGGNKSLKKVLTDWKIDAEKRAAIPLIAKKESGEILAVAGVEIAESVKITPQTKKIAYIALLDENR